MASTYSALKIELIGTGEQSGTWGTTTNTNLGDAALGEAITGSADVAFSSADVTITLTDTNATQAARNLRLNLTGTSGGARNLILGSGCQIEKLYLVNNGLADAVTVKNTSGTGIAVAAGKTMFVYNNGTNVVDAITHLTSLTTGVLSASGATTFTAGTASTSTTTGTAVITGGLGVSGRVNAANFDGIVGANTAAAGSFTSVTATSITNSGLTSGRVVYSTTGGLETDSANLLFNGTTLTANTIGAYTLSGTIAGGGNQLNNIIIGTSTPLAGSFTTINASTSITNAGLTSGRVTFASTSGLLADSANLTWDGSFLTAASIKDTALTSGRVTFAGASGLLSDSANLFWDNTNARLGIGTASPSFKLHLSATGNVTSQAYNVNTDTGAGVYVGYVASTDKNETALRSYGSGFTTFTHGGISLANFTELWAATASSTGPAGMLLGVESASPVIFATNNTEKMRITSAGLVGIGTSSPAQLLHLNVTSGAVYELISSGSNNLYLGYENTRAVSVIQSNNALVFDVGSGYTERVRIDTSGNVSVGGFAPSAWSVGKAIEFNSIGNAVWCVSATQITMPQNAYFNGAWRYGANGLATRYAQEAGVHQWWNAPNNTSGAGASLTFTQAMTLDASGRLGISTSSPTAKLHIAVDNATVDGTKGVRITNPAGTIVVLECGVSSDSFVGSTSSDFNIRAGNVECARFTTAGNVGIGTSSPSYKLSVANSSGVTCNLEKAGGASLQFTTSGATDAQLAGNGSGALVFYTGTSLAERMRIDSSGNLFVNCTTTPSASVGGVQMCNPAGTACKLSAGSATSFVSYLEIINGNGLIGSITGSGSVTSYNVTSDQRLKTNIVDAPLGNINDIKVRSFDWIADNSHQEYGMVAQELLEVAPYAVTKPVNPDDMMQVDYSKLVPMMIKEIQDLKQRIATLENK